MPTYEIVKPYNHEVKAGDRFEVETLHPSLKAHVKLVSGSVKELVKTANNEKKEPPQKTEQGPAKPVKPENSEPTAAEKRKAALEARKRAAAGQGDEETDKPDEITVEEMEALHDEAIEEDAERFPSEAE